MIDVDLNFINNSKTALETETDINRRNSFLYDIIYSASRMLLVTRGVEPKTTSEVYNQFIKNFIEFGLVDDKFRNIVLLARDEKKYNFTLLQNEIFALADAVAGLYKNMDDSLQFKNVENRKLR